MDPISYRNRINAHPPTSVLLFLPLAGMEYRPALLAWNLAGLVMLGVGLAIVYRQLELSLPAWSVFPTLAILLLCRPLLVQLFHGQLNLALLVLVTAAWAAARSGQPRWAGALVGAAMSIKVFPGFLFLYLILRRQWSAVAVGALTVALLTGITAAVLGPGVYLTYVRDVLPRLESFRSSWFNASLVGFWTRLFNPATLEEHVEPLWRSSAAARTGIVVSWIAVVAAVTWSVRRARTRIHLDHAFGASVTGMLLCSPITWDHSFVLLLVPIAVLWVNLPGFGVAKLLLIISLAALSQEPLCRVIIPGGTLQGVALPVHTLTVVSYHCYAMVSIMILSAARAGASPRQERT